MFQEGPSLAAVFPLSLCTWASSLKVGLPSHFLMSSPWSCRKNQKVTCSGVPGLPFPLIGALGLHGDPLATKVLPEGTRREKHFLQNFRSRKKPELFTQLVYVNLGNTLLSSSLEVDAGLFGQPSSTWPIYTGCHLDLWRPCCHLGDYR